MKFTILLSELQQLRNTSEGVASSVRNMTDVVGKLMCTCGHPLSAHVDAYDDWGHLKHCNGCRSQCHTGDMFPQCQEFKLLD